MPSFGKCIHTLEISRQSNKLKRLDPLIFIKFICATISVLFMNIAINRYIIIFLFSRYGTPGNAGYVSKQWLYFTSPVFNVTMFYKIRVKIIFVKMGLGSWQQMFGKSVKIVLILMPDYLFASQFEPIFFLQIKGQTIFWEWEKNNRSPPQKTKGTDPLAILYMVSCTVCQDIEEVASEHPSSHDPETNQHTYLCPKIGLWKSIRPYDCSCDVLRFSVTASSRDWFWSWDCFRPLRLDVSAIACDCPVRQYIKWSECHLRRMRNLVSSKAASGVWIMLEDRRSPPQNRVCSCDYSRSLRKLLRSPKIAWDYRARLVLYRSQTGRKRS